MMHDLPDRFDERNMFLLSVLGCLSIAQRVDDLMALRRRRAPHSAPTSAADDRGRDHLLHALLGVLSLAQTVHAHARLARSETDRPPRARQAAPQYRRLLV